MSEVSTLSGDVTRVILITSGVSKAANTCSCAQPSTNIVVIIKSIRTVVNSIKTLLLS